MNWLRSLERYDRGLESHSRHGCLYCVRLFCVSVVLCVGRGLATADPPSKESYRLRTWSRDWKSGQGPINNYRAIIITWKNTLACKYYLDKFQASKNTHRHRKHTASPLHIHKEIIINYTKKHRIIFVHHVTTYHQLWRIYVCNIKGF
jgi:hypothetical protein